jgi:hypothetical protein
MNVTVHLTQHICADAQHVMFHLCFTCRLLDQPADQPAALHAPVLGFPACCWTCFSVELLPFRIHLQTVPAGYLISLLASLLLYMHPLRGCLAEMLWPDDASQLHPATTNPAAGAQQQATATSSSSSAFAVPGSQQRQQQQQDHNPIDDTRVLLAFDSMDQPAFGSWKPGGYLWFLVLHASSSISFAFVVYGLQCRL